MELLEEDQGKHVPPLLWERRGTDFALQIVLFIFFFFFYSHVAGSKRGGPEVAYQLQGLFGWKS